MFVIWKIFSIPLLSHKIFKLKLLNIRFCNRIRFNSKHKVIINENKNYPLRWSSTWIQCFNTLVLLLFSWPVLWYAPKIFRQETEKDVNSKQLRWVEKIPLRCTRAHSPNRKTRIHWAEQYIYAFSSDQDQGVVHIYNILIYIEEFICFRNKCNFIYGLDKWYVDLIWLDSSLTIRAFTFVTHIFINILFC